MWRLLQGLYLLECTWVVESVRQWKCQWELHVATPSPDHFHKSTLISPQHSRLDLQWPLHTMHWVNTSSHWLWSWQESSMIAFFPNTTFCWHDLFKKFSPSQNASHFFCSPRPLPAVVTMITTGSLIDQCIGTWLSWRPTPRLYDNVVLPAIGCCGFFLLFFAAKRTSIHTSTHACTTQQYKQQ